MCGISALISPHVRNLASIGPMTDAIRHRGPDDEGFVVFGREETEEFRRPPPSVQGLVAFGHRRLSILDLSDSGHQPMSTLDRRYWIIHNGEVYNYLEIRRELEADGIAFHSGTDTEVILQAYRKWGEECLHRFNGMFAFVIYDQTKRRVFAARDRFGIKPLYYWMSPQGYLALASEIKQFTVLPGWQPQLSGQDIYDFLHWGVTDHRSTTCFADVHQLRGGQSLTLDVSESLRIKQWYKLESAPGRYSFSEAADRFRELLSDSVSLRLRADVDVGSCLSGGLDSSSIVCLVANQLQAAGVCDSQKTFSACSEEKRFDERSFMEIVANGTEVDARYTYPSLERLFDNMDAITWHQDEPFASTSIYAQWSVFDLVKQSGVKVMLDGQGADEQLAGYHGFFQHRFFDLFRSLRWIRLRKEMQSAKGMHSLAHPMQLLANQALPNWVRTPLRKVLGKRGPICDWIDFDALGAKEGEPFGGVRRKSVDEQCRLQLLQSSLPMLLRFEDRDSMAHSIEARTPFLDYRLVEFLIGLPADYKIRSGWTKRVMREGMKGTLPETIRKRVDKIGFATAEEVWMRDKAPQLFRSKVEEVIEESRGILKPQLLSQVDEMLGGRRPFNFLIWRVISFGAWMKAFQVLR